MQQSHMHAYIIIDVSHEWSFKNTEEKNRESVYMRVRGWVMVGVSVFGGGGVVWERARTSQQYLFK